MIAHVAAAGEGRGRVVLRIASGAPNRYAIAAAIRLAKAYQSEIESLFVEDVDLVQLARFPFTREVSPAGRATRRLDEREIEREFRIAAREAQACIAALAEAAEVPHRCRVMRDRPARALAVACAESGPWNVIALAEPFRANAFDAIREMLLTVVDATGLLLVGPNTRRTNGPVLAVVEDAQRMAGMVRVAERIAAVDMAGVVAMLMAEGDDDMAQLEGDIRLALATDGASERPFRLMVSCAARGEPAAAAEAVRRMRPGFVIARLGGVIAGDAAGLKALGAALECPLLLVR